MFWNIFVGLNFPLIITIKSLSIYIKFKKRLQAAGM